MSAGYTTFILKTGFESIYENDDLMLKYREITNKEYEDVDDIIIKLLRKFKNYEFKIYHVKNTMLNYISIERCLAFDVIKFNSDKYKLDMIKKILSSEGDNNDLVMLIESITFQDSKSPILTDSEYLEHITN